MKNRNTLTTLLIAVIGLTLSGCGTSDDAAPTEAQRVTALMKAGVWKVQQVTVDSQDQTAVYENLTLSFSDGTFTAVNGAPVWPASGTWTFDNDQATSFTRNDGLTVNIDNISGTSLVLRLVWGQDTFGPGRVASISGQTVFTMVP